MANLRCGPTRYHDVAWLPSFGVGFAGSFCRLRLTGLQLSLVSPRMAGHGHQVRCIYLAFVLSIKRDLLLL
jgi:hypothetical protein